MEEIRRIIEEYKEVISDPGISEYHKILAKLHAFDDILEEINRLDRSRCTNCDLYFKAMTKEEQKHDVQ